MALLGTKNDYTGSAAKSITYTIAADVDLVAAYGNMVCRRIRINSVAGGSLSLMYNDGSTDTIPNLQQGETLDVQAAKLVFAGTTAVNVTVFW